MNRKNVSISILLAILPLIPLMALAPAKAINGIEARQQLGLEPEPIVEASPDAALQTSTQLAQAAAPESKKTEAAPQGTPLPAPTTPPTLDPKATPSDSDVEAPADGAAPLPPAPSSPKQQSVPSKGSQSSPPTSALPTQIPKLDVMRSPLLQPAPVKPSPQSSAISSPLPKTPTASLPIAPVEPLPSLTIPEGYARVVPLPKAIASVGVPNLPKTPQSVQPVPQSQLTIAFRWGFSNCLKD